MSSIRQLWERDRGAALALVATSLFLLMGVAAISADLGYYYLSASRIQRAADAASLAGVVHLPQQPGTASSTAIEIALLNGYEDGDVASNTTVSPSAISANQLEVRISTEVDTFFAKVLGWETMTIARTAVAEYIPPLRLGSPSNVFGNDPSCYSTNPDCAGNFWANIHGQQTDTRMGDAFSSFCADGEGSTDSCDENPAYRSTGYLYGVVPGASSFTVETLDMAFHNDSGGVQNGNEHRTGDHNEFCSGCPGPTTKLRVYKPDATPLILETKNAPVCTATYAPQAQIDPDDDAPFSDPSWVWDAACTIDSSSAPDGIWVVQVVLDSEDRKTSGLNRYSIRTNVGNIFGLGDFSLFSNEDASVSTFYLAEVLDYYAGKTFVVELYDPGDSNAGGVISLIQPGGGAFSSCTMATRDEVGQPWSPRGTISPCQFTAQNNGGANDYDGEWVKLEMTLPATGYVGGWWKVQYDFAGGVEDTTTWRAYMIGNPIHLID